jgi:hypothetical protein
MLSHQTNHDNWIKITDIVPGFGLFKCQNNQDSWKIVFEHADETILMFNTANIHSLKNGHASFWKAVEEFNKVIKIHPMTGYQLVKASVQEGWQPAQHGEIYANWLMERLYRVIHQLDQTH